MAKTGKGGVSQGGNVQGAFAGQVDPNDINGAKVGGISDNRSRMNVTLGPGVMLSAVLRKSRSTGLKP